MRIQQILRPQAALALCLLASSALLLGAFLFEYVGGLAPCKLCIWQRWPHVGVILFAGIGLVSRYRQFMLIAASLSAMITAAIGLYHVGVEQGWWPGLASCSSQTTSNLDLSQLTEALLALPVVRCDEIAWQFIGVSMAGWNSLLSVGIAGLAILAVRQLRATGNNRGL